jgi:hypothetical protein
MKTDPSCVFQTLNVAEAELVCSRLQAAGFDAAVTHALAALSMEGYSLSTGGVRVEVPADEADEARAFLETSAPTADDAGAPGPDSPS